MSECGVVFYEGNVRRALLLLREGFRVRHPMSLVSNWKRKPCKRRGPVVLTWGYVYIFAAGDLIKVGRSDAGVKTRWSSIRTGNPLLEAPLYVSPPLGDTSRVVERAAHGALAAYREAGEWFRCDRQLAIDTVKRIAAEVTP